jgi:serine/threonine protein kinase/N-acetylneuraminic acid mutarotase
MEMARKRPCSKCGAEVPGGDLQGLCPACVAKVAFVGESENETVPLRDLAADGVRFFGDYELLDEIARGGMGVVYKARQISLNRTVAVKMILAGQLASPADVQRFLAEAEAAADLQHPNIVAIHEVGQYEGQHYFSMAFVEGENLTQLAQERGGTDVKWCRRAATYVKTIAEAIDYAHQRGTLHRDLKPSNILIDAFDQPRITDFGLARRVKRDSDLTMSGQIIGSPNFMPPEQAAGRRAEIGPQSDVYSLGALLYFLLTNKPPFQGDTVHDTLTKVLNRDPEPPRALNRAIPRDLETIGLKCLEKSPARRYPSAQALADDLGRFLNSEPVTARPITRPLRLWRRVQRHRVSASLAAALVLLCIVLVFMAERGFNSPTGIHRGLDPMPIAEMPAPSAQGISAVIDGMFYVTSATAGLSDDFPRALFVYDPRADRWRRLAESHVAHSAPAGGVIGGKLYLVGGSDATNGITGILEVYDPASGQWQLKQPMLTPRSSCAGAVLGGKLYVIGGTSGTNFLATVECYDPATDTWATQPSLAMPRAGCGAAAMGDTIFVVGGITNLPGAYAGDVVTWKPGATNWSTLSTFGNQGMLVPVDQPFVAELGGVVYVFGGNTDGGAVDRAQCLVHADPGWMWMVQQRMPAIRYMGCGAVAYGDEIWLFGGWTMHPNPEALPHADVFIFYPKGNSWRTSRRVASPKS